jgi:hypothetical protein
VFAHVTPSFDTNGKVIGYHSNRRKPEAAQIAKIQPIYRSLLEAERRAADRKLGMHQSHDQLFAMLKSQGVAYDEFVFAV